MPCSLLREYDTVLHTNRSCVRRQSLCCSKENTDTCGQTTYFTLSTCVTAVLATRSGKQQRKQDSCE